MIGTFSSPASRFSRRQSQTRPSRHDGIEQHDVRLDLIDDPHRRKRRRRDHDGHAGAVERVGEQPQRLRESSTTSAISALFGISDHSCAGSLASPLLIEIESTGQSGAHLRDEIGMFRVVISDLVEFKLDRSEYSPIPVDRVSCYSHISSVAAIRCRVSLRPCDLVRLCCHSRSEQLADGL